MACVDRQRLKLTPSEAGDLGPSVAGGGQGHGCAGHNLLLEVGQPTEETLSGVMV